MNDLEVFRATVSGQKPARVLYTADFTPDLERRLMEHAGTQNLARHYGFFGPVGIGPKPPPDYQAPDYSVYYADEQLPEGTKLGGDGPAMVPSGFYHFWGYVSPLRKATSLAQLEAYPLPDQSRWATDHMAEQVAAAHREGRPVTCWVGHMYETAWQIRGYEQFLIDMMEQPAWAECILDKLFRRNMVRATAAARAGADYLTCGDDVANQRAMMFSLPMWRSFMLSRWAQVWSAARAIKSDIQIWYHTDGNAFDIVPELMAAGVTILNPVQPECMDPAEVRQQYPTLNLHGTIGTQSTMPWGTPDEVRRVVRERIRACGAAGRLILGPTHVLEPEVPIANIEAYVEACREGS